jgi:hypothetical protein
MDVTVAAHYAAACGAVAQALFDVLPAHNR